MTDLERFRGAKNDFFAHDRQSPLSREQKRAFKGLNYFPEAKKLRFELPLEQIPGEREIAIPTSTGEFQTFQRAGLVRFTVDGQEVQLTVFSNDFGYFLPFVDSLSGQETYPAGRYLEPELLPDGRLSVDFNLAYNPYCAYNDMWSCPLTPAENRLTVPIRAGEMIYHRL